jgi:hypothetical protein
MEPARAATGFVDGARQQRRMLGTAILEIDDVAVD